MDWDNNSHSVTSVTLNVTSVTTLKKDSTKGPKSMFYAKETGISFGSGPLAWLMCAFIFYLTLTHLRPAVGVISSHLFNHKTIIIKK